jgi:flagellar protein FliT
MKGTQVIAVYERMLAVMQQMHEAARTQRWDDLVVLERSCRRMVDELAAREPQPTLAPPQAQRRLALIGQVLALDAAIRDMTEPWLQHLQVFLGSRKQERKLHQAYGTRDGG